MTTIVCKDGKMCSDSQATRGDFIDNTDTTKIFNVKGCLIGISGSLTGAMKFIEWFEKSLDHTIAQEEFPYVTMSPPEELVNENFHCLVLYPDNKVFEFFGATVGSDFLEVAEEYCAVGSGMQYALCAMDAGATPEEAVAVAIKRDVYSGGEVQVFEVEVQKELTEEEVKNLDKDQLVSLVLTGNTDMPDEDEQEPDSELGCFILEGTGALPDGIVILANGTINDGIGEFTSFGETIGDGGDMPYFSEVANMLGVKFAHNISMEKLAKRLDEKVKEIVAQLNE